MKADVRTGASIYYERQGSGPPLVLICGTGCDHVYWDLQVAAYSAKYDVIAIDTRGGGQSTVPNDPKTCTSALMAADVAGLLDILEIPAAHISGHSLGSCVAQFLLAQYPARVLSAQLHASWDRADTWLSRAFVGTTLYPLEKGDLQQTFKTVTMWMLSREYLDTRQPPIVADMVSRTFIKNPNNQVPMGMLAHLNADATHKAPAELRDVRVPVLVTSGESDYLIPAFYGQRVARLIPGSEYHIFEGPRASHAYNWELSEEFNNVTLDFLARAHNRQEAQPRP